MQDSNPEVFWNRISSRLNAHWQTDWAIEDQSKNLNSTTRPYDQRAFSPLDATAGLHSHLSLAICMFVVVNFDALAMASDIQWANGYCKAPIPGRSIGHKALDNPAQYHSWECRLDTREFHSNEYVYLNIKSNVLELCYIHTKHVCDFTSALHIAKSSINWPSILWPFVPGQLIQDILFLAILMMSHILFV